MPTICSMACNRLVTILALRKWSMNSDHGQMKTKKGKMLLMLIELEDGEVATLLTTEHLKFLPKQEKGGKKQLCLDL